MYFLRKIDEAGSIIYNMYGFFFLLAKKKELLNETIQYYCKYVFSLLLAYYSCGIEQIIDKQWHDKASSVIGLQSAGILQHSYLFKVQLFMVMHVLLTLLFPWQGGPQGSYVVINKKWIYIYCITPVWRYFSILYSEMVAPLYVVYNYILWGNAMEPLYMDNGHCLSGSEWFNTTMQSLETIFHWLLAMFQPVGGPIVLTFLHYLKSILFVI